MKQLDLVSPVDDRVADPIDLAPRIASLEGSRIGLLDNRKGNANLLLQRIGELLASRGATVTTTAEKRIFSRPATEQQLSELASATEAVVTAIGD